MHPFPNSFYLSCLKIVQVWQLLGPVSLRFPAFMLYQSLPFSIIFPPPTPLYWRSLRITSFIIVHLPSMLVPLLLSLHASLSYRYCSPQGVLPFISYSGSSAELYWNCLWRSRLCGYFPTFLWFLLLVEHDTFNKIVELVLSRPVHRCIHFNTWQY